MGEWKLPREFPAEVRRRTDGGYDLRVGRRHVLMRRREAECVLADLEVLLKEGDRGR